MTGRLIKMEFYQITHNVKFYTMLLICCAITWFFTSSDYLMEPIVANTPDNSIGIFMNQIADVGVALIILIGCYSAYLFSEQFKQHTINLKISCGYSRVSIYLIQCLITFLMVGLMICFSSVIGCFKYGIGNFVTAVLENAGYFMKTMLLIFFLAFSIVSFCLIFSVLFQDTTKTLIVSFVFLFVSCYIMAAIVSNTLTVDHMAAAYDIHQGGILKLYPPYLWRWSLNPQLDAFQLFITILISMVWSVLAVAIGCYIFCKREIK